MSQVLTRTGRFNLPLLGEEVAIAAPELFVESNGVRRALHAMTYDGTTFRGVFPDVFDLTKITDVLRVHDPDGESINQLRDRRRKALLQGIINKFLGLGFTQEEIDLFLGFLTQETENNATIRSR